MRSRMLGDDLEVSEIGLGCMGMSEFYGARDDEGSRQTLTAALDLGATFWDTADMYGSYHNEQFIGDFISGMSNKPVIATKFGIVRRPGAYARSIDNSAEYIRSSCEGSLKRLGIERIDLYYVHRLDPKVPIEDTMATLSELVKEGKIAHIGLCEVSARTLERACSVHPVAAVQSEYSLWTLDVEKEVLAMCRHLGVGFVAYSPLGRGFLTGKYRENTKFETDDVRALLPRFEADAMARNIAIVDEVTMIAARIGCTPAQLCLAWLLAQGEEVVPIPGTKKIHYLNENCEAPKIKLNTVDLAQLQQVIRRTPIFGERYTPEGMKGVNV
ncbi:aldo/keto reductase [Paracoccus sp. SSJ]|nr:aldo/keto reductase [Paracoccus sp. SSJ]